MFNAEGLLPAGFHDLALPDVHALFANAFPHSTTRPLIVQGFVRFCKDVSSILLPAEALIDGSFVTTKNDPSDMDIIFFFYEHDLNSLNQNDFNQLRKLFSGSGSKPAYMCDAYMAVYPDQNSPNFDVHRINRKYWMGEFGFDRLDRPKGIVRIVGGIS